VVSLFRDGGRELKVEKGKQIFSKV